MLKLYIGNKNYSSWSLRGWLACKQSGLDFDEIVVPLYDPDWDQRRKGDALAPSAGKVPILWDGDAAVWDSLAIIEHLNERSGGNRFWPVEAKARALARSVAAEMHAGFMALRRACPMNIRQSYPAEPLAGDVAADVERIVGLWGQARSRFGEAGPFLFGRFGAVDIMFAPVVTRLLTYALPVPPLAESYMRDVVAHPFMQDWIAQARSEQWIIERFERPRPDQG